MTPPSSLRIVIAGRTSCNPLDVELAGRGVFNKPHPTPKLPVTRYNFFSTSASRVLVDRRWQRAEERVSEGQRRNRRFI